MVPASDADRRRTMRVIALTAVVVLAGCMLRAPFVAVAPVARQVGADLGVSAAVVGLLTSIPVFCFAVCAPLAVALIRRGGVDLAFTLAMAGAVVGCLIRATDGIVAALVGTAVMGAFLAIGNVVVPIVIARDYGPGRAHAMTGVYTSSLNVGTMTVSLATAPLAGEIGWRAAILVWGAFGVAALAVWIPLTGAGRALTPAPRIAGARPEGRGATGDAATWLLAAAFSGQAFAFYAITAWLPTMLADQGFSAVAAGAISSIFQVGGVAGALVAPLLAARRSLPTAVGIVGVAWVVVPIGFLAAPGVWLVWCVVGGLAQGAGITLVFIMMTSFRDDEHRTAGRSGFVQGVGYAVAAVGPILLGGLHEWTHGWTLPLVTVLAATVLFLAAGITVARRLARRVAA